MRCKELIIKLLEKEFPDWEKGTHEECLDDAAKLIGKDALLKFLDSGDWQGQDMVLNVFQAIRNR